MHCCAEYIAVVRCLDGPGITVKLSCSAFCDVPARNQGVTFCAAMPLWRRQQFDSVSKAEACQQQQQRQLLAR